MNDLELIAKQIDRTLTPKILKKEKLIALANSVLLSPQYKSHFEYLLKTLSLDQEAVISKFLDYNLDIFSPQGNEIYVSLENRIVLHIHNLINKSWHIERQKTVWDFIQKTSAQTIADIGFGVPSLYLKNILAEKENIKVALCDLYPTAFEFAKSLLPLWNENWGKQISFIKTNMDTQDFIGPFDLYMFQDSIEHTVDPTSYLEKYVHLSPTDSLFLFSLPIGPIFPRHYIAWETNEAANAWLNNCGLQVIFHKNIYVNLEVDLFAEDLGSEFNNYMVLCRKS